MFSEKNILQFHLPKLEKSVARKKVHQGVKGIMYCKIHMYPLLCLSLLDPNGKLTPSILSFLSFLRHDKISSVGNKVGKYVRGISGGRSS